MSQCLCQHVTMDGLTLTQAQNYQLLEQQVTGCLCTYVLTHVRYVYMCVYIRMYVRICMVGCKKVNVCNCNYTLVKIL